MDVENVSYFVRRLLVGREGNPLLVDERHTHATDRAGERQAGDLCGRRRCVDGHDVVEICRVEAQNRDDDLDLVAEPVDERGAQWPVDQSAGENRVRGRSTFAAEERSRDTSRGVHALFHIDRQREEVESFARAFTGRGGREEHGVFVEVSRDSTGCLLREAAGLETDAALAVGAVVDYGGCFVDALFGFYRGCFRHSLLLVLSSLPRSCRRAAGPGSPMR